MTAVRHGAGTVLALVVALQLVAETAMTPYLPQLFRALFGVEDLAATGSYLTVCRVAGLAALPLWGAAAHRWPLKRLLVVGLVLSAAFDLGLSLAPTIELFTVLSAGVVATGGSLILAYPALVALLEGDGASDRVSAVVAYSVVFHASAVVATALGAGVVAMPEPRVGLALFAVLDLALAVLVWRGVPTGHAVTRGDHRAEGRSGRAPALRSLALVAAVAVLVDVGHAVTRPFFVELVLQREHRLATASILFLLPSCAALAVLPAVRPLALRLRRSLLPASAVLAACGLVVQASASGLPVLVTGRLLLGAGLGIAMVALDLQVFAAAGTRGPAFAMVETARAGALLTSPLLATVAARESISLPLLAGALLLLCAGVLAPRADRTTGPRPPDSPSPTHRPEVPRDPETVH